MGQPVYSNPERNGSCAINVQNLYQYSMSDFRFHRDRVFRLLFQDAFSMETHADKGLQTIPAY